MYNKEKVIYIQTLKYTSDMYTALITDTVDSHILSTEVVTLMPARTKSKHNGIVSVGEHIFRFSGKIKIYFDDSPTKYNKILPIHMLFYISVQISTYIYVEHMCCTFLPVCYSHNLICLVGDRIYYCCEYSSVYSKFTVCQKCRNVTYTPQANCFCKIACCKNKPTVCHSFRNLVNTHMHSLALRVHIQVSTSFIRKTTDLK